MNIIDGYCKLIARFDIILDFYARVLTIEEGNKISLYLHCY